jgi:MotA/TolQ/ExbB proton channel family
LIQVAGGELDLFNRGITVLDTALILGPLLGLLGTVVGMIRAFRVLGGESVAGKRRQSIVGLYPLLGLHLAQDGCPEQRDGCLGEG